MKKSFLALLMLILTFELSGQDLFGVIGRDFTSFDYKNESGEKLEGLQPGSGTAFEAGVALALNKRATIHYASSLMYNNYKASLYVNRYSYSWRTSYLGIKNMAFFKVYETKTSLAIRLKAGFGMSHIISGKQDSYGVIYDLTQNEEFKGVFIAPEIGAEMTYEFNKSIYMGAGYAFNKSWNLKKTPEKLSFNNHYIYIGVYFRPKIVN